MSDELLYRDAPETAAERDRYREALERIRHGVESEELLLMDGAEMYDIAVAALDATLSEREPRNP